MRRAAEWARSHRRSIADLLAFAAFVAALAIGLSTVGLPWAASSRDRALLYDGIVVAAAFVIAAMVQRVVPGEFAITAGRAGVSVPPLSSPTVNLTDAAAKLRDQVSGLAVEVAALGKRADAVEEAYIENVPRLDERLGAVEERLREGN